MKIDRWKRIMGYNSDIKIHDLTDNNDISEYINVDLDNKCIYITLTSIGIEGVISQAEVTLSTKKDIKTLSEQLYEILDAVKTSKIEFIEDTDIDQN